MTRGKLLSYIIPAIFLSYLYFNRKPVRIITPGYNLVSPADGTIIDIKDNRIEIFIGITDIHEQRAPQSGQITNIIQDSPLYNMIELETKLGRVTIERWAGDIARTVTTSVKLGQYVEKGQIIGHILLGSHTAITISPYLSIKVIEGQHVLAGETILAE